MNHACARLTSGKVMCWGYNSSKQADPASGSNDVFPPKEVPGIEGATRLFVWNSTSCALTPAGWMCWGQGFYNSKSTQPLKFEGLPADVKKLSGINQHACAILADDSLACWGLNQFGQLGDGTNQSSPKALVKPKLGPVADVAAGVQHTCAITQDGQGHCWGHNQRGQLGDGTLLDRNTPTRVKHLTASPLPPAEAGFQAVPAGVDAMTWPDSLPEGCKHSPTMAFKHPSFPGMTTYEVRSARASKVGDFKGAVEIANFIPDPNSSDGGQPRGNQSKLRVDFTRMDTSGEKPAMVALDAGEYSFDSKGERFFVPQFIGRSGNVILADISLLGGTASAGHIKLTYIGEDWVCGEMNIETKDVSLKGPFAAQMGAKK
jgi:hypothetical protein